MSAKEMFEELGYKTFEVRNVDSLSLNTFNRNCIKAYELYNKEFYDFVYMLFFDDKSILKWNYSHQRYMYISFGESEAIIKQGEELGWGDK